MARQPLRVAIFVTVSMLQAAAWEIKHNAYYSYFNVAGDVSEELQRGMRIKLNGEIYEVTVSHGQSGDDTYVQLDRDHEANPGDTFELADEDAELPYGTTTSTTTCSLQRQHASPRLKAILNLVRTFPLYLLSMLTISGGRLPRSRSRASFLLPSRGAVLVKT